MRNKEGRIISVNNFKGGVSKTSTACALAYILSEWKEYKILVVDFDPQADATELLIRTFDNNQKPDALNDEYIDNIFDGLKSGNRTKSTMKLSPNLDLIPSDFDLIDLSNYLINKYRYSDSYQKVKELDTFLQGARAEYDFVIIDTPPTISDFSNNAIYSCDYSLLVMQTHRRSYRSIDKFVNHLVEFQETYGNEFDILGIIPVMFSRNTKTDLITLNDAMIQYKEDLFNHVVKAMERVKYWDEYGISEEDHWDKKALKEYEILTDELLERLNTKEEKNEFIR